jgi:hypothetical protein
MAIINFYETNLPYGCFSNFSRHPLEIAGRTWPTAEHFIGDPAVLQAVQRESFLGRMTCASIAATMRSCQALPKPAFVRGLPDSPKKMKRWSGRIGIGRRLFVGRASVCARTSSAVSHVALSRGLHPTILSLLRFAREM